MANRDLKSVNFKLPQPLADALAAAAQERKTSMTDLVIQGLHQVLGHIPGTQASVEIRLHQLETQLNLVDSRIEKRVENNLEERVARLEQQQEALALRLAQIEGAISVLGQRATVSTKRQPYRYHPPQLELQAYTEENLAKRLGVDGATLARERENPDFERWCRSRDPGSLGWKFAADGLYYPIK